MANDVNQTRNPTLHIRQEGYSVTASFNSIIKAWAHFTKVWPQTVNVRCSRLQFQQKQQLHFNLFSTTNKQQQGNCRHYHTTTELRRCSYKTKHHVMTAPFQIPNIQGLNWKSNPVSRQAWPYISSYSITYRTFGQVPEITSFNSQICLIPSEEIVKMSINCRPCSASATGAARLAHRQS